MYGLQKSSHSLAQLVRVQDICYLGEKFGKSFGSCHLVVELSQLARSGGGRSGGERFSKQKGKIEETGLGLGL